METHETAISRDHTELAFWRSGSGPALLLVHGTSEDRHCWKLVRPHLATQFTTYTLNRRGREGSGSSTAYALEREFEDIAAVVEAIGEPVHVFGHSAGALCALGAATLSDQIRSLVLYEPPMPSVVHTKGAELLRKALETASPENVVLGFFRAGPGGSDADIERLQASSVWPSFAALATSIPPELEAIGSYAFRAEAFSRLDLPVLFVLGETSPPPFRLVADALSPLLRNGRHCELSGQGHMANIFAPEALASVALEFLRGP